MAILYIEGFEGFGTSANMRYRYKGTSTANQSNIVTGRDGSGKAIYMDFGSAIWYFDMPGGESAANLIVGCGFQIANSMVNSDVLSFYDTGGVTEQVVLRSTAAGELAVDRGATQLGITSGLGLLTNVWYYLEIDVTFGDATAGSVEVFLNDSSVLSLTGIDTRTTAGENCGFVGLKANTSGPRVFDDLYILDDQGTDQTTRIGPCIVETVFPDANGTTNNFTPSAGSNYQNVDEGDTPDDDTTYNSSSTVTHKDLYGHAALTGSIDTVYAVMPRSYVRVSEAGGRGVKPVARSNVTEVDGTERFIDQSYVYVDEVYENDPNGGGAWTESSVNAAEFGIKITT